MLDLDVSGMMERLRGMDLREPAARLTAVTDVMRPVMGEILAGTPVDTGRLRRGYAMAANAAGLGPAMVNIIKPTKYGHLAVGALFRQIGHFERQVKTLEQIAAGGKSGRGGWYQREFISPQQARSRIGAARRRLVRAKEELAKHHNRAITIGAMARAGGNTGNRLATTVREKIYGGSGRLIHTDTFTGFQIHNLEPHATIIEHNTGSVKEALTKAKAFRIRRVGRKYLAQLEGRKAGAA